MSRILPLLLISAILPVAAQGLSYEVEREYVVLQVEPDGVVLIEYNLTVGVLSGAIRRFVRVGAPAPGFSVLEAWEYLDGPEPADYSEVSEDGYYAVEFHPKRPIEAGESRTFQFLMEVRGFLYRDEENPGNLGLEFWPSWFEDAPVRDLRVMVILPPGVGTGEFRCFPDYDSAFVLEDGRVALYWERTDLEPGYIFKLGVSFPEEYVPGYEESELTAPEEDEWVFWASLLGFSFIFFLVAGAFIAAYSEMKKSEYEPPFIFVEGLGAQDRLSPVEAAYLLRLERGEPDYPRIVSMIILDLVRLDCLEVESVEPLRLSPRGECESAPYYGRRLLRCIDPGGGLDETCVARTLKVIHRAVERKVAGYSRRATIEYYRKRVADAWTRLASAEPEEKEAVLKEELLWLMVDEDFHEKLRSAMRPPRRVVITVDPSVWVWRPYYWSSPPAAPAPARVQPAPVDIVAAADGIARGIERTVSSIASALEDLADKVASVVVPAERARSARRSISVSCICACVSCACACACVSCACACAGGGAG